MEEDRISQLPDEIRHKILSYIPTDEAIAMSLLSRAWRDLWITLPSLYFDYSFYKKRKSVSGSHVSKVTSFHYFIQQTVTRLSRCNSGESVCQVLHLYLPLPSKPNDRELVADWLLNLAVKYVQVKELHIQCDVTDCWGGFVQWFKFLGKVFPFSRCLKNLSLCGIRIYKDMVLSLATNCLVIEVLKLVKCHLQGPSSMLKVSGLYKLHDLLLDTVSGVKELEVAAPNLVYFQHCKYGVGWREYSKINLSACQKLKHVQITQAIVGNVHFAQLIKNLEYLSVNFCVLKEKEMQLNIASDSLKFLNLTVREDFLVPEIHAPNLLELRYYYLDHLQQVKTRIYAPNLKSLCYTGSSRCLSLSGNMALATATLFLDNTRSRMDAEYLNGLLRNLNSPTSLEIHFPYSFMLGGIKSLLNIGSNDNFPVMYEVKHVTLKFKSCKKLIQVSKSGYSLFLKSTIDTLIWLAPHPETILIQLNDLNDCFIMKKYLKFKYKVGLSDVGNKECARCNSLPIICWQHCLQEVEIQNFMSFEGTTSEDVDLDLQAFFENARNDERIIVRYTKFASKCMEPNCDQ